MPSETVAIPKPIERRPQRRLLPAALLGFFAIAAVIAVGLKGGSPSPSWGELAGLISGEGDALVRTIVAEIRLPRVVLGLMVGAMLAVSGTLMQGAMNNRLAGPELLGLSAGASLAAAAILVLRLPVPYHLQPLCVLAGGLAGGAVVIIAARIARGAAGMLLIGMSVTAMLNGLLIVLIAMGTSNDVNLFYAYLLGSLANRGWEQVLRVLPWFAAMLPVAFVLAKRVNLLQLGDDSASGLGINAGQSRIVILLASAMLVASTVAECGPIGYVSLLAPHLARAVILSQDARLVLPVSALIGAVMLALADQLGRLLFAPLELPVGVWTTLVGGTVFLLILSRRNGGAFHGGQ